MTPTDWADPAVCERAYRASIFTEPAATELRGAIGEIRRLRAHVAELEAARAEARLAGVRLGLEAAARECHRIAREWYDQPAQTVTNAIGWNAADECKTRVSALDPTAIAGKEKP